MINSLIRLFYPAKSPQEIQKEYGIPGNFSVKIRFTKDGYFVLTCPQLPGLITEAKDGKELIKMFNDAVLNYYDVPKRVGDVINNVLTIDGHGKFTLDTEDNRVRQTV